MKRLTFVTAAAVAALVSLPALAQVQPLDVAAPPQAQLTMAQAIVIAEYMGQGKAIRARLDERAVVPVYTVTVKSRTEAPLKLQVATQGGRIVASERKGHGD